MRNLLISILLLLFSFGSQAGASQLDAAKAGEWSAEDLDLVNAIAILADSISTSGKSVAFLIEGWTESHYFATEQVPGTDRRMGEFRFNSNMPRFDIDAKGKSVAAVLDEITAKHGSYVWSFDARHQVINVVEKHLLDDPRWPLNWSLTQDGNKPLTFDEAHHLLYFKYHQNQGGDSPDKVRLFGWNAVGAGVWNPAAEKTNSSVRDLVNAMIRLSFQPKMVYRALMTAGFDTRLGYTGLKDLKDLPWSLPLGKARSMEQAREIISHNNKALEKERMRLQKSGD